MMETEFSEGLFPEAWECTVKGCSNRVTNGDKYCRMCQAWLGMGYP